MWAETQPRESGGQEPLTLHSPGEAPGRGGTRDAVRPHFVHSPPVAVLTV